MDGPNTVMLHGLGSRPEVWQPLRDRLGGEAVGLPWQGLGGSAWSRRDPVDLLAAAVDPAAELVIAHSFGSLVLLAALARGVVRPRAAVLISPFYKADPAQFRWDTAEYTLNGFHRIFEEALEIGPAKRYPEDKRRWMARQMREAVGPYGWTAWFQSYLDTPYLDLGRIEVPVLAITGDNDIAAPVGDGVALAAALPDASFVLCTGCGHFPMLQHPEWLAGTIDGFVRTALPESRSGVTT